MVPKRVFGQQDLCSIKALDSDKLYAVEDVTACYNSIPANPVWINSTLTSLHQLADLYVFTDYNAANIAPWNVNVDLHSVLTAMGTTTYSKDYEFQKALINLFNSLHDPNTRYFPPRPYQSCYAVKPFALLPKNSTSEGEPKVYLAENLFVPGYNYSWAFNPADYYNWEVTRINGDEVMAYLNKYAKKSSTFKDPMVRLNSLFKTNGWNVISGWSSYNLDSLPVETLQIKNGAQMTDLTLPYRAYCSKRWTNTEEFVQQIQTATSRKRSLLQNHINNEIYSDDTRMEMRSSVTKTEKVARDLTADNGWTSSMEEKINQILAESRLKRASTNIPTINPLFALEDDSLLGYMLMDSNLNSIPLLKVQSFSPRADLEQNWVNNVRAMIDMMQRFNCSYIVLDVSGNKGGSICKANLLAALLVKDIHSVDINRPAVLWSPYAARKTPLNSLVYNNDLPHSLTGGFINTQTGEEESADIYYNSETVNIEIGKSKKQATLTKFTYYPHICQPWIANILPNTSYWPSHIMIITDGNLGNAAAMFVAKMKQQDRATIVTYGGSTSSSAPKVASAQAPGGRIFSWDEFTKASNVTKPFITSAEATFAFNSAWSVADSKELPLEFQTEPFTPDHQVMTWDPLRFSNISSAAGLEAFTILYRKALELWPSKDQPFTPIGEGPIAFTPVEEPATTPDSTSPLAQTDTPAEGMNVPAMVVTILIFVILVGCVILFVVFKYLRGPDGWLVGKKYRLFGNPKLQENLLTDRSAAADANL